MTIEERAKIDAWTDPNLDTKLSVTEMARMLDRSRKVVGNYIRLGEAYGRKMPTKGNSKLSTRQKNQIIEEAIKNRRNCTEIRDYLALPVTSHRVGEILRGSGQGHQKADVESAPQRSEIGLCQETHVLDNPMGFGDFFG